MSTSAVPVGKDRVHLPASGSRFWRYRAVVTVPFPRPRSWLMWKNTSAAYWPGFRPTRGGCRLAAFSRSPSRSKFPRKIWSRCLRSTGRRSSKSACRCSALRVRHIPRRPLQLCRGVTTCSASASWNPASTPSSCRRSTTARVCRSCSRPPPRRFRAGFELFAGGRWVGYECSTGLFPSPLNRQYIDGCRSPSLRASWRCMKRSIGAFAEKRCAWSRSAQCPPVSPSILAATAAVARTTGAEEIPQRHPSDSSASRFQRRNR